ncbi:nuclear transport factor 2 family protein [Chryseolinea soli]|uniref:Nuclear transport factor 2 family protein n=1 Tax=Chryseolinea soli TaxID=2321403 RepID=A0A385SXS3_9BACT|nr:nuclear transport factor 2 family protein [Chryseolinea soli]AYB34877.1 nuclear transport factor 2 family protein [Chryseolinea soli]
MMNSKNLLLEYLDAFSTPAKAAALFAPDGVLETPYLQTINMQPRLEGPREIEKFLASLMEMVPDWKFSNIRLLMADNDQVVAEYEVHAMATHTNRPFDQLFFGRLVKDEHGKIKLLREAQNLVCTARALLKNGVDDIPRT